jgi:hypothetical protein
MPTPQALKVMLWDATGADGTMMVGVPDAEVRFDQ